jgi:hypothetical protein
MKKSTLYTRQWQINNPWRHKYNQANNNAKLRNIPFLLTFNEWQKIWMDSGKWEQRGWRKGQYVMARFGDKGAYEIGNVRVCLAEENRAERNQNYSLKGEQNPAYGKDYWASASDEERIRRAAIISEVHKGKPKSAEQRAKMRAAAYRFLARIA